jgi:hypothetical protein
MKKFLAFFMVACFFILTSESSCSDSQSDHNRTAKDEQQLTEVNQQGLLQTQPPPHLTWSLERENLIKRFKMMNDRSIMFYMYIFNEGVQDPIGYYQINKVSSVNSQLTNTMQIVMNDDTYHERGYSILPSPAEDGSYGTNGDGVFGFTPEDIYIEHNMNYICSSVPLSFTKPVNRLTIINVETQQQLKEMMDKINVK